MKNIIRPVALAAAYAVALMVAVPSFAADSNISSMIGRSSQRDHYDRVVMVGPQTRSVNIIAGDAVHFIERKTGYSFVHEFDTNLASYELSALAPAGMFTDQPVMIHVFAASPYGSGIIGHLGDSNVYNRVITITPSTKWVNIAHSELVKIIDAKTGNSFVWNFDGRWDSGRMDLSAITPRGLLSREHVIAYVSDPPPRDARRSRR